jgi:F-type H+-transporting ATPase subunit beta
MTATTVDGTPTKSGTPGVGRVARVIGPVVDIEFPSDQIPEMYNALTVKIDLSSQGEDEKSFTMTLEVAQHLGDSLVRAIAQADGRTGPWRPRDRHRRADQRPGG